MIVTKEEAKKLWCPMVREAMEAEDRYSANRGYTGEVMTGYCIADGCMMWVWNTETQGHCGLSR